MSYPSFTGYVGDPKFLRAFRGMNKCVNVAGSIRSTSLKSVASTFEANMNRVLSPLLLVPNVVAVTAWFVREDDQFQQTLGEAMAAGVIGEASDDLGVRKALRELAHRNKGDRDESSREMMRTAERYVPMLEKLDIVHHALWTSLSQACTGLWTAFEVLANQGIVTLATATEPERLRQSVGEVETVAKRCSLCEECSARELRRLEELRGKLLRIAGNSHSRSDAANVRARREPDFKVHTVEQMHFCFLVLAPTMALEAFSPPIKGTLQAAQRIRNVLVHRGGICDPEFERQVREVSSAFSALGFGDFVPGAAVQANGFHVAGMLRDVQDAGIDLLSKVDQELHLRSASMRQ